MKPTDPPATEQPLQTAQTDPAPGRRSVTRRTRRRPITARTGSPVSDERPPKLRLVGAGAPDARQPVTNPEPIASATDPRWVLAVRTAEVLEGDVLPPAKREGLMQAGKAMGLTAFDCSLIIAIVQDRARRGIAPAQCPAAGEEQLAMVPKPGVRPLLGAFTDKPGQVVLLAAGLLALQALLVWIWLS